METITKYSTHSLPIDGLGFRTQSRKQFANIISVFLTVDFVNEILEPNKVTLIIREYRS